MKRSSHHAIQTLTIFAFFVTSASHGAAPYPISDLTYGNNGDGIARIAAASVPADDVFALHATVQTDGRLVLVGSAHTTAGGTDASQLVLARFETQGVADTSFGAEHDGIVRTEFVDSGGLLTFGDVAQTEDGQLIYTGHGSPSTIIVGRLNDDGLPDASFGSGGRRLIGASALVDGAQDANFSTLLPMTGGKLLALGVALRSSSSGTLEAFSCAMRLMPNGSSDTSFGSAGRICIAPTLSPGALSITTSGHLLADGHILLAGVSLHSGGSAGDMSVARLLNDGTLDANFGSDHDGWAFVAFDQGGTLNDGATAMALDASGRILLTGYFDVEDGQDIGIARLLADGRPDLSFGTQGRMQVSLSAGSNHINTANSIVALPNGGVLVGALVNGESGVSIALKSDGSLDPAFGEGGIYVAPQATPLVRSRQQILAGDYIYRVGDSVNAGDHSDFTASRAVLPLFADSFENPNVTRPAQH